jgi:VIT1/CCC1 family predicted Fe2+/Mn2+ transporter
MAVLTCDICGGNLSMDASGDFAVCESCGMRHTKDRVKAKYSEISGNPTKPVQTIVGKISQVIPKRFTDRFINDEITELLKSIEKCQLNIESLGRAKDNYADQVRRLENNIQREKDTTSRINRDSGFPESFRTDADMIMINSYNKQLNDATTGRYKAEDSIREEREKQAGYKIKQRELDVLLQKTEVQRAEEHYQSLLAEKRTANNVDKLTALEKKFREMEGYADTAELASECGNLAKQIQDREERERREANERRAAQQKEEKYQLLLKNKNKASSEKEYRDLAIEFRLMNGYKDTTGLASECDDRAVEAKYNMLIEAKNRASTEQEFQSLARQFQVMNGDKNTAELASECYERYNECKKQRIEVEYNELAESMISASTEQEYQDLVKQLQAMDGYKNTAELANKCDKRYCELKEQREERERVEQKRREDEKRALKEQKDKEIAELEEKQIRQEKNAQLLRTIFSLVLGGIVGGLIFWIFAIAQSILGFITVILVIALGLYGIKLGAEWWTLTSSRDIIGGGVGCLGGAIVGLVVGFLCTLVASGGPSVSIPFGVVVGAVAGHFIKNVI